MFGCEPLQHAMLQAVRAHWCNCAIDPSGSITLAGTSSVLPSSAVMLADCADSGTHTAFVCTDATYTVKCVHYISRSPTDSISNPCTHAMPFMTSVYCAHISIHSKKDSLTSYAVQWFKRFTFLTLPPLLTIYSCTAGPADREGWGGGGSEQPLPLST